tara:strand:- start:81 stop:275 length:195 start_codon:yes stop_codon:yes gene_type:complete
MDIFRATREAERDCEIAVDFLQVIQKGGLISKYKKRDKGILENVIRRLTIQKETLHRFKETEDE